MLYFQINKRKFLWSGVVKNSCAAGTLIVGIAIDINAIPKSSGGAAIFPAVQLRINYPLKSIKFFFELS